MLIYSLDRNKGKSICKVNSCCNFELLLNSILIYLNLKLIKQQYLSIKLLACEVAMVLGTSLDKWFYLNGQHQIWCSESETFFK